MRVLFMIILSIFSVYTFAQQTLKLTPQVTEATVYRAGAKVTAEKKVYLNRGEAVVVFENLSPNIDKNSIRIKGLNGVSLNYFTYETDYLKKQDVSKQLENLKEQLSQINRKIAVKTNQINALNKTQVLLEKNQELNTSNNELTVAKMNAYTEYYRNKLEDISTKIYDLQVSVNKLNTEQNSLQSEIKKLEGQQTNHRGKISFNLKVTKASQKNFSIDYFIYDAGWFPTFDLTTNSIESDMNLAYKAKVYQASGRDWSNIKLSLSTANPETDTQMPELSPLYVNYISRYNQNTTQSYNFSHLNYNRGVKNVSGIVLDNDGLPLPGVNVLAGNNGTQTDFDGRYSIDVNGAKSLTYKYLGFKTARVPVYSSTITLNLINDSSELSEVVVTGYSKSNKRSSSTEIVENEEAVYDEEVSQTPITTNEGNSFSFTFPNEVSLKSSLNNSNFDINNYQLNTEYNYYIASEYSKAAYLIAKISDWQDLDLVSGEAKIYFNNSYVGQTSIDVNTTDKDLLISLGKDDQVIINRTDVKQENKTSFFGSNKIITKTFEVDIKNNKSSAISILVEERTPISRQENIKVEEVSHNADFREEKTGYLQWKFELQPKANKQLKYSYQVKYPKDKNINISAQ
ncbi:mucoidy inhibitor MuiA family protein [Psychroflexus sp. ALD_RP9]|uniref:mucoidy inhibitor MuiA family protein n=1 Tax=Psychroflexus sp. ALD_RP9 TaxID=2777186 RepID=UPI001A8FE53F|nr:mucoidy inhibitor MuiA family protein [Psychroflexus sp. ALD_RP9]QSS97278.1 mucoidy inhibitor MuiA family protein [Psychroflexus sp. ALD_RP9]